MGEEKPMAPSTMDPSKSHERTQPQQTTPSSTDDGSKNREVRQPFPCKVYEMLEDAEEKGFDNIVSWNAEGNGFTVHIKERFTKEIVPKYFNQTRYKSFQRQLSLYGFERATSGNIKGLRYHEKLRRGCKHLCRQMKPVGYKPRGQESRTKLRSIPGPADARTESVSQPVEKLSASSEASGIPQPTQSLPTVVSSESIHKGIQYQCHPPLVSPQSSDRFVAPHMSCSSRITERLVTTDSVAVFEGMPFFLMTTLPLESQDADISRSTLPVKAFDGFDSNMGGGETSLGQGRCRSLYNA